MSTLSSGGGLVVLHKIQRRPATSLSQPQQAHSTLLETLEKAVSPPSSSLTTTTTTTTTTAIRRELVQSRDDELCFYAVDTIMLPSSLSSLTDNTATATVYNDADETFLTTRSVWKILFPDPHQYDLEYFQSSLLKSQHAWDPLHFLVFFYIKPNCITEFINLIREEGFQVQKYEFPEKKCLRFDLLQSMDDPTRFLVVEILSDWAAIDYHHAQEYYQTVRKALESMQSQPRSHDGGYKILRSSSTMIQNNVQQE